MKRFVHVKRKLLWTLVAVLYYALVLYCRVPCVFEKITDIPCPGCGMTRAWLGVLRGDLLYALRMHPWFWSVPFLYGYILADGKLLGRRVLDRMFIGILLGGFAAVFLCRLLVPAWRFS